MQTRAPSVLAARELGANIRRPCRVEQDERVACAVAHGDAASAPQTPQCPVRSRREVASVREPLGAHHRRRCHCQSPCALAKPRARARQGSPVPLATASRGRRRRARRSARAPHRRAHRPMPRRRSSAPCAGYRYWRRREWSRCNRCIRAASWLVRRGSVGRPHSTNPRARAQRQRGLPDFIPSS